MAGNLTTTTDISAQILPIYSRKLLEAAVSRLIFWQLCLLDPDLKLDKSPGEQILFNTETPISGSSIIPDQDSPINFSKMSAGEIYLTFQEFGRGVKYSRKSDIASLISMMEKAVRQLNVHYAQEMDKYLRDIFFTTANKHYSKSDGTSGSAYSDVNTLLNVKTMDSLKEKADNLNFPRFHDPNRGDYYVFVGTPRQMRQVNRDTLFNHKKDYAAPTEWLNGEIGMFEGVVFLSSTNMNDSILADSAASSKDCHRGLFISPGAVGIARAVAMRLSTLPYDEVLRSQSVLWYCLLAAGILQDYVIEVATNDDIPS